MAQLSKVHSCTAWIGEVESVFESVRTIGVFSRGSILPRGGLNWDPDLQGIPLRSSRQWQRSLLLRWCLLHISLREGSTWAFWTMSTFFPVSVEGWEVRSAKPLSEAWRVSPLPPAGGDVVLLSDGKVILCFDAINPIMLERTYTHNKLWVLMRYRCGASAELS